MSSQHSDGNAHCTSQEAGADGLPQPKRKDSEQDCRENVSELEKIMLKAFEEQEDLSPANTPNLPHSNRTSPIPSTLVLSPARFQDSTPERGERLLGIDMLGCDVISGIILIDSGVVGIRIFFAGMLAFTEFEQLAHRPFPWLS